MAETAENELPGVEQTWRFAGHRWTSQNGSLHNAWESNGEIHFFPAKGIYVIGAWYSVRVKVNESGDVTSMYRSYTRFLRADHDGPCAAWEAESKAADRDQEAKRLAASARRTTALDEALEPLLELASRAPISWAGQQAMADYVMTKLNRAMAQRR